MKAIFEDSSIAVSTEDTGGIFASGYHCHEGILLPAAMKAFRIQQERLDNMLSLSTIQSISGGTGSGFALKLMHSINAETGSR